MTVRGYKKRVNKYKIKVDSGYRFFKTKQDAEKYKNLVQVNYMAKNKVRIINSFA